MTATVAAVLTAASLRAAPSSALAPRSGRGSRTSASRSRRSTRCNTKRSSTSSTKDSSKRICKPLKHGKEASVHLFRANPRTTGEELVALKLYHPLDRRDFRDETLYRDGEFIKERRMRVALEKKTALRPRGPGRALGVARVGDAQEAATAALPVPRPIEWHRATRS